MLIKNGSLTPSSIEGQIAIITGAGRGIGFETARALIWLGATVIIAEIDTRTGREAKKRLNSEFGKGSAAFIRTDVSNESDIYNLKRKVLKSFQKVDILINNATITPMGAVKDVAIKDWDASYGVNLRGPVLLARAFLPGMLERDYGVIVCVSSVGEAFMAAYETFKAAQAHLGNTLDAELEGTGVHAFTIGPGLVRTPGANAGIEQLAPLYGKTIEEFYAISDEHIISVESAGAGFAAAVAMAAQFRGQEISSKQALIAAGISLEEEQTPTKRELSAEQLDQALVLCRNIHQTLEEQSVGWRELSLFERQWMIRDFKKNAGMSIEQWLDTLSELVEALSKGDPSSLTRINPPLNQLEGYFAHMQDLARGYEQNPAKLVEQLATIQIWRDEIRQSIVLLQ